MTVEVGVSVHESLMVPDPARRRRILNLAVDGGLDHVALGDHISFHGGIGFDGLLTAASVLSTHDSVRVLLGVYQPALRHPMLVARQLSSLSQIAPGRLVFGVGAGGEDRAEISNSGVDPRTRGRRLDESLEVLSRLSTGEPVDHHGEFFDLDGAVIRPAPDPRIPIVIGGTGDVAVRRTERFGDGWLGIFCSPRRFAEMRRRLNGKSWFGLTVWCGLDRDRLGARMEQLYRLPPERFAHLAPAGSPERVAESLMPYVEAGATSLTIVPVAETDDDGVRMAAEVAASVRKAG